MFDDQKKPMKIDGNPFPVNMISGALCLSSTSTPRRGKERIKGAMKKKSVNIGIVFSFSIVGSME